MTCYTRYTAGSTIVEGATYGGAGFGIGIVGVSVTWNVTCRESAATPCDEGKVCKPITDTTGPYLYTIPLSRYVTDRDAQNELMRCKDNDCINKVLSSHFGTDNVVGHITSLISKDGLPSSITPTHNICKCVGEDETLIACDKRCAWENRTRAEATNDAFMKKSLSN